MFIVDGTGEESDQLYDKEMKGGFCRQLEKLCRGQYRRGPTLLGRETSDLAAGVVEDVLAWRRLPVKRNARLFLAGHSRGGAAVIYAAQELEKHDVTVDAMFLFDAVERNFEFTRPLRSARCIPPNVKHCYHALRETSLAFMYSDGALAARNEVARLVGLPPGRRPSAIEDALDLAMKLPPKSGPAALAIQRALELEALDGRMKYVMRTLTMKTPSGWTFDFGNCGTEADGACRLKKETFLGSHGALGGAPIIDERAPRGLVESDRAAMASVQAWMWSWLSVHDAFARP